MPKDTIIDSLKEFFTENGFQFSEQPERDSLFVQLSGDNGRFTCLATRMSEDRYGFLAFCPVNVPPAKRLAVAEVLTRANYGLWTGCFELDFDDGEVRFRTSGPVPGKGLTGELISPLFFACTSVFDSYLPAIMAVIYSDRSPQDAIAEVEARTVEEELEEEEEDDGTEESDEENEEGTEEDESAAE